MEIKTAELIVQDIIEELSDRSGSLFHNELDAEIAEEIKEAWINIILKHAPQPTIEVDELKRCHICMNLGYTERFCYNCGREANSPTA